MQERAQTYAENRNWSDQFIPQIRQIIGPHLLEPAALDLDCKQNTDLIVLTARDMRIACRVRKPGYFEKYMHDFTIRSGVPSGAKTEFQKVIEGWGDWMFYGHAGVNGKIHAWLLINLASFRAHMIQDSIWERRKINARPRTNSDGTSFQVFDIRNFLGAPPPILIASHGIYLGAEAA
jgi:hypothetical protein